jgi:voltage-gated sodium channel
MTADRTTDTLRDRVGRRLDSRRVQDVIVALVVLNAAILGLETSSTVMAAFPGVLKVVEHGILVLFVVEIAIKLYALDLRFFRSAWNVFDFLIVAVALVPASGPFAILRTLRILRVLRLLGKVPRLRRIIESLLKAVPSIGWIVFLLSMVFYIFGVMGTQLFGAAFPDWFGTLGRTLYTLFQVMTLESWSMGIARPVIAEFPMAWLFFITFILITAMTVLNLFIGVIVSTMQEGVHADDVEQRDAIEIRAQAERTEILNEIRHLREHLARMEDGMHAERSDQEG